MNDYYIYLICVGIGLILGIVAALLYLKIKKIGVLRVDSTESKDNPYLFLEFEKMPSNLNKRKYVILKVNPKSYFTQE